MFPDLFRDDVFTLETERLFLRWPKAQDAREVIALAGDRAVAEMTSNIPHPYPVELATKTILEWRSNNAAGQFFGAAIVTRRNPGRLIGMISLRAGNEPGDATLGYWLGQPFWGKGFATQAARALIDAGFLFSGARSISASVRVTNTASRKVLERCGFQYEGGALCERAAWGDSVSADTYRLTRPLWASLKGWRMPVPAERADLAQAG